MLNDKKRNACYQTAITKAITQGHNTVLDIGSGTGILSMFAVQSWAKSVFACEESKEMVRLSHDVLAANQMQDKIHLLNKLSTDMSVPEDIPNRVSLVVTEIFDAGLFGEGVISTLQHAWQHLLLPPKTSETQDVGSYGKVIPSRAVIYAQVIQCEYIRKQNRFLQDKICNLDVSNLDDTQETSAEYQPRDKKEPYTSERLQNLPLGYQALTPAISVLEVDFNNPQIITSEHPSTTWRHIDFPVIASGKVDAVISWFDLVLDDTEILSTSPHDSSCWEQAVFPVTSFITSSGSSKESLHVREQDTITVAVSCSDDCLHLKCADITHHASSKTKSTPASASALTQEEVMEEMVTSFRENVSTQCQRSCDLVEGVQQGKANESVGGADSSKGGAIATSNSCSPCDDLTPDTIAILNDYKLQNCFYKAITSLMDASQESEDSRSCSPSKSHDKSATSQFAVLDISSGVSVTGLFAAKHHPATRICIPSSTPTNINVIETIARTNMLEGCFDLEAESHPLSPSSEAMWDVLVTDLVSPCGTLRERVLEDIAVGRVCALKPNGTILPGSMSVFAMCVECASLQTDSQVIGDGPTMGLKIAKFINKYKVSTFLDIHLSSRAYKQISQPFLLFHLDFNEKQEPGSSELPSFVKPSVVRQFQATEDGTITAIPFWFNINIDPSNSVNTLDNDTHWKQAAYLLPEGRDVKKGDQVKVSARIEDSSFIFEVDVG
ncbi:protein arginine N-methyltransferase 9-like isoform X2 [Asterias rubens]|nr:protein arginine N-methyltransferase 9-like isoform X2 [Asterias rubens]